MPSDIWDKHTCDKFKGIREIFFSFQGGFEKCIEIGKLLIHFREISLLCKKLYIFWLISGSLPDDQGGFTRLFPDAGLRVSDSQNAVWDSLTKSWRGFAMMNPTIFAGFIIAMSMIQHHF